MTDVFDLDRNGESRARLEVGGTGFVTAEEDEGLVMELDVLEGSPVCANGIVLVVPEAYHDVSAKGLKDGASEIKTDIDVVTDEGLVAFLDRFELDYATADPWGLRESESRGGGGEHAYEHDHSGKDHYG